MAQFILIRHGQTDWNIAGRYQGQADPPLNVTGWKQAQRLAEKLQTIRLNRLYSSPLLRAAQTAQVIAEHLQIPLQTDARLMEIHQGDWQTRLRSEIQTIYPELFKTWESRPWQVTPPGGESLQQVQKRIYQAIDEILAQSPDQVIGIVAHRVPIALLKIRFQGLDPDVVRTLELPNTYYEAIEVPSKN